MVGIYLSGTGNTKHCTEKLVYLLDEQAQIIPLEDERAAETIKEHTTVVFAYPVQFSNAPVMARDFIKNHAKLWQGKQILCMATMGAFSGDGAGCSARLFKKYGAKTIGGLHIRMPDSVCDLKLLKKSPEENRRIILAADRKLESAAAEIRAGRYPKEGLGFISRLAGLFGQRLWFYDKTRKYSDRLKISDACTRCGQCVKLCPMRNITMRYGKPVPGSQCTMCYRCISRCPGKAITLLGKQVHEQCQFERYIPDADLCK